MGSRFPGSKEENIGHFFQISGCSTAACQRGAVWNYISSSSLFLFLVLLFITARKTSLFFLSSHLLSYLVATNRHILRRISVFLPPHLFILSPLNCHLSVTSCRWFSDMKSFHSSILPLVFPFFFCHLISFLLLSSCPSSSRNDRGVSLSSFFLLPSRLLHSFPTSSPLFSSFIRFSSPPVFFLLSFPFLKRFHRIFLSFFSSYFLSCWAPFFHLSSSILLSSHARFGNCRGGRFLGSVLSSTRFSFKRHLRFCSIDL